MGSLRIILALSVVMGHGLTTLFGAKLFDAAGAVWVFFTISGFLITIALSKKYDEDSLGLRSFYINRLIRIYPIYWTWLIISVCVYLIASPQLINYQIFRPDAFWSAHIHEISKSTFSFASIANFSGFFHDSFLRLDLDRASGELVHHGDSDANPWAMNFMVIGQFWSIGVELIFYAIAPWVTKKLWRIAVVFLASATGMLEQWWVYASSHLGLPVEFVYMQTPKYIWMFMLGAALAHLYISAKQSSKKNFTAFSVLIILIYSTIAIRGQSLFPIQSFPWWLFTILTLSIPLLFEKTAKNKVDKFLGELSYPIYICHFLLIQIIGSAIEPNGAIFAVASCATALALVFLIDRPAKKLKISLRVENPPNREKTNTASSL